MLRRPFLGAFVLLAALALAALPASGRVQALAVDITSGPPPLTTSTTATFTFTINPGWGTNTVICDLDGKIADGSCTSPKTYTGLAVGEHTFTVATYAGEIGVGSDSWTWIVDSTTPDFLLKTNEAELPLTILRPLTPALSFSSTTPVTVKIVRLGGSHGPVSIAGATQSGNAFALKVAPGLQAKIVPDNATNPLALTVSLTATSDVQPVIGKSFALTVVPGSAAVGSVPHTVSIPYAIVNQYDLAVQGIDVTQGIQPDVALPTGRTAAYAGVKLVKDKRTMVRVFAAVAAPQRNVTGARIFLYGWWLKNGSDESLGAPLVSAPTTLSFSADASVSLPTLELTQPAATFILPPYWTEKGPITLEAKVVPASLFQPQAESECSSAVCVENNRYKLTKIPFIDTGYVNVWALYLKLRGVFDPCCTADQFPTYLPSAALAAAQQLMPLAEGELRDDNDFRAEYDVTGLVKLAMTSPLFGCPAGCSLNDYLVTYSEDLEYHQVCPGTPSCPDVVMSMIDDTPLPGNPGWPSPWYAQGVTSSKTVPFPSLVAGTTLVRVRQPLTSVAHELGHSLSLLHASWGCKGAADGQKGDLSWPDAFGYIHGLGVDVRNGATAFVANSPAGVNTSYAGWSPLIGPIGPAVVSIPGAWYDFMSYCADSGEFFTYPATAATPQQGAGFGNWKRKDAWISVRNWNRLQAFLALLKAAHTTQSFAATVRPTATDQATLAVDGFVDDDGRVVLTRIGPRAGRPSAGGRSEYELVLRSSRGGELQRWPLEVTSSEGHGAASTFLAADVPLAGVKPGALPANLAELQVESGGTVLARVARSATAPTVRVLSPTAGERVGADRTARVEWRASDPDPGSSLIVTIDYSSDNGERWDTVYKGPNTGRADIPSRLLSTSSRARIRIRASDGFDETAAASARFVAVGRPPAVRILSPRQGEQGRRDVPLYLAATAYDDEGAFLDERDFTWYDGRREIARGRLASVTGLAAGTHVLRAVAGDSKGRRGAATVRVRIVPSPPALILSRAPATVASRSHSLSLRLACSLRARLSVDGPAGVLRLGVCGPETRAVSVPIRPGDTPLRLEIRAEADGRQSKLTLVFVRA